MKNNISEGSEPNTSETILDNCDLVRAKQILNSGNDTCVLCRDETIITSTERGVKPLLEWLDGDMNVKDFSAADKVVGRAAAFLYVLLEVRAVYANVMSKGAVDVFLKYGIQSEFGVTTEEIINRQGTGSCPMEQAVKGIDIPEQAVEAVRKKCLK